MTLDYRDIIDLIENKIGKEQWVFIYRKENSFTEIKYVYSAIIPDEKIVNVLNTDNWDLTIGSGLPSFGGRTPNFEPEYLRFGNFENIEPLIYIRTFGGIKEVSIEISQEFIHYFNLYYDQAENKYVEILNDGKQVDVFILRESSVKVRLKHLKIFLAIKKSHLAIYFDIWRFSNKTLKEQNIIKNLTNIQKDTYKCSFEFLDNNRFSHIYPEGKSCSWFLGKKLISKKKNFTPDIFYGSEKKVFEEFITGIDENGDEAYKRCDPFGLGANEFLSPVFFNRGVLRKYFDNPHQYEVLDCYLICKSFWGMPIDNNKRDYVVVFLGDLGKHLSNSEQVYWKGFNVNPDGKISKTYWERSFMNRVSPPEMPDLYFKQFFRKFSKYWYEKFGWYLFKPLNELDSHSFSTLHIPLSESPAEFEHQVLSLTKIIIDSINQKELKNRLIKFNKDWKSIDKLIAFFGERGINGYDKHIKFLRNLQSLRSKAVAHRKNREYAKEIKKLNFLDFEKKGFINNFIDILQQAIQMLQYLKNASQKI
ncbi:hypothetical protein LCGC14_0496850 [marine sediment metagenome]|uniref:Uncharacterized protein n=1 Tax=marine sediment metagenome TaxID=412755 RepID=A0A0F9SNF5_9ZZZZ|nr:hypothetical protein [archaeon]HEC41092.1 hypothetical protein [bacterium]